MFVNSASVANWYAYITISPLASVVSSQVTMYGVALSSMRFTAPFAGEVIEVAIGNALSSLKICPLNSPAGKFTEWILM